MAETNQATIEGALRRLTKERELYERERDLLQQKLSMMHGTADHHDVKLVTEQIGETSRALEVVVRQIEKYTCECGEK